jgi:hypothetical protein
MRDSINYNLKYFIMKMSGTKPMKNTMRKSPLKQGFMDTQNPAIKTAKKLTDAVRAAKLKKTATNKAESTKTEGTKAATKPTKSALMQTKKRKC